MYTMTNTITTRNMPANENGRGNLAGTEIRCSCGYVEGTTLGSEVPSMVHAHAVWHDRYDAEYAKRDAKRARAAKATATRKRNADPFGFKRAGLLS